MNIQLKFGMPEALVLYSLMMFSQDKFVALATLTVGIIGRTISTMVDYGNQSTQKSMAEKDTNLLVS